MKDLREIGVVVAFAMTAALLVLIFAPSAPPPVHLTQTAAPVASAMCVCAPAPAASSASAEDTSEDVEFPQRPRFDILATKKKPQ